jgi:hypothetical protein
MNDATAYGVTVTVNTAQGKAWRWECTRVHHLRQDENNGNHNLYVNLIDETGERARTRTAWIVWPGAEAPGTIPQDKPDSEPGGNAPLWKHQVVAVGVNCADDEGSDVVSNITTEHPDEQPGNTLFHHSFLVEFTRVWIGDTPQPPPPVGPVDPGEAPAKYWGWVESTNAALNEQVYRLHRIACADATKVGAIVVDLRALVAKYTPE